MICFFETDKIEIYLQEVPEVTARRSSLQAGARN